MQPLTLITLSDELKTHLSTTWSSPTSSSIMEGKSYRALVWGTLLCPPWGQINLNPKKSSCSPWVYAPKDLSFSSFSCWKMVCIWNATWSLSWMRKEGKGAHSSTIYIVHREMKSSSVARTCWLCAGLFVKRSCFKSNAGLKFSVALEWSDGTFSESESSACFSDCSSAWTGRKSSQRLSQSFHPSTLTLKMVGPHSCVFACWMPFFFFFFKEILTFVSPLAVETIVITPFLPVVAFGRPLPKLSQE